MKYLTLNRTATLLGVTLHAVTVVTLALLASPRLHAAEASPAVATSTESERSDQLRFFESRIRPLLIERCFECHSAESAEGGLRLDVADALTVGGDSGQVVVAGEPDNSLLLAAVRYDGLEMPPDAPLSPQELTDIETWITQGAYWPITESAQANEADSASWWAAEPIDPGIIPPPVTGVVSPTVIDRYIDAALDDEGLARAPMTDRARLIRRLSYDLLGLPPTPQAIDAFVNDESPAAYERLVDRMFADPAYGERMARLWLDVVRYADSDGWRADAFRKQAWLYREFVTDAFNSKMPYDRFVALQLAGDELAPSEEASLAAVHFMRLGIYEFNQRDAEGQWQNIVDEITDVTADVFLATGLACAKCHDHKFDPISRADYFRLRSVFEPVLFIDRKPTPVSNDRATRNRIDALLKELRDAEGDDVSRLGDYQVSRFPVELEAMFRKSPAERNSYEHQISYLINRQIYEEGLNGDKIPKALGKERNERRLAALEELDSLGANPYADADLLTIVDAPGEIRLTRLPGREQGATFEPAAPGVFGGQRFEPTPPVDSPTSSGRRTALANWITSPENPITSRVMVNRLWQYLFGTGLVASPNDFGRLGETPSHPRLLDYLAKRFIDSGWDIQSVQREMVLSATYQQSAVNPDRENALAIDADNRLLWHKNVRRLDAEQYRDSLLVAMDKLIDRVGGPSIEGTAGRRSLYLRRYRNSSDEMLAALDAPPGIVGTAKRDVTTTATQSLMMLNSPRVIGVAESLADRVRREARGDARAFVDRCHRILTGMAPDELVTEMLVPLVEQGPQGHVDACHVLLNSNAFLFVE